MKTDSAPRGDLRPLRAAIVATGSAFAVTMMGTTLPTPLYPIYSTKLGFTTLTVTALFAVYAIGVVATLILFGRLSDQIGPKPVLLTAVSLAALSALLFLLPPTLPLLVVARVISGMAAGLMSGAGTASVIDLYGAQRRSTAGTVAVAVNTGGLALGTLLAGIIADTAPLPLAVPYAVELGLAVVAFTALWLATPAAVRQQGSRWRLQRLMVPVEIRGAFVRAVLAAGAGFAVTGVLTAVTGLLLARYIGIASHAAAGGVVFLAFAGMAVGQLVARRMSPVSAQIVGCGGMVVAAGLIAVTLAALTAPALVAAAVIVGVAGGICLNAGLALTVERVPVEFRGSVSSAFFAGLYAMLAGPAIGVGVLARWTDLRTAGMVFAAIVAILAAAVGGGEALTSLGHRYRLCRTT